MSDVTLAEMFDLKAAMDAAILAAVMEFEDAANLSVESIELIDNGDTFSTEKRTVMVVSRVVVEMVRGKR